MEAKSTNILASEEIEKIINTWKIYAPMLRRNKQKSNIYKQMREDLEENYEITLTETELRKQLSSLLKRYRIEKRKNEHPDRLSTEWEHFEQVNELIGCCKENSVQEISTVPGCSSSMSEQDDTSSQESSSSSSSSCMPPDTSSDGQASLCSVSIPETTSNTTDLTISDVQNLMKKAYDQWHREFMETGPLLIKELINILYPKSHFQKEE